MKIDNFIAGRFQKPLTGQYLKLIRPSDAKAYGEVASSDVADVNAAVSAAQEALPQWSSLGVAARAEILVKIADGIDRRADALAKQEAENQGKPVSLAREIEIPRAALNFRFFAREILQTIEASTQFQGRDGDYLNYSVREPLGVVGLISPWNLPLYLLTWKIAPALAAGNTVVCKPSELTPVTAASLCEIFDEAGLPPGVCNVVFGLGERCGAALTSHPGVSGISFTGGTATAESIIKNSVIGIKKLSLELGGKNPALVFGDANLDEALPLIVRSSFQNQGEICLCSSRIYVEKPILKGFLERFVQLVSRLKIGDSLDPATQMGPLVSKEHFDKVMSYVELAKKEGAKIHTGGKQPKGLEQGYYLEPTVITDLPKTSRLHQDEVFGPVVVISPFEGFDEGIALANNTRYGLSATVWTQDLKKGHQAAAKIRAGTVWVNSWMARDLRMPFGGMKQSGVGREGGGGLSLDFYSERKTVSMRIT